ncbi:MAG: Na(+)-translocating NADH-quinone reductase subunit C [Amphritea sp.]
MASSKDTVGRTVTVAVVLCVVCSIIVSAAAVLLRPAQQANKELDRKSNILAAAGISDSSKTVDELFEQITTRMLDMETGKFTDAVSAEGFDARKAAKDPALSIKLTSKQDIASIRRQARYIPVYLVENEGDIETLVLPVHGYGLWSTLYGFIALEGDLNTVAGLGFYEHAETPGLGGEVDNPNWKALWSGKQVYPAGSYEPALGLIKGTVDPASAKAAYQVDGLSGATLTSVGVTNLVQFWMGENGYAPFLANLKAGGN